MACPITVNVSDDTSVRLLKLAKILNVEPTRLISDALQHYLDVNDWQVQEISRGLSEADSGELITHNDVLEKWETKPANSLDKDSQQKPR